MIASVDKEEMTIEPDTRYEERLLAAEKMAKENKAGFWSTGFFH